jgi:hypothetical protein
MEAELGVNFKSGRCPEGILTESTYKSTLLSVAPAEDVVVIALVAGRARWAVAGECGNIRFSIETSISVALIEIYHEK